MGHRDAGEKWRGKGERIKEWDRGRDALLRDL